MLWYIEAGYTCCGIQRQATHVVVYRGRLHMLWYIEAGCTCCGI